MTDDEAFQQLLDAWEDLLAKDPRSDLEAFLKERAGDWDDATADRLRRSVRSLAHVDEMIGFLQQDESTPSESVIASTSGQSSLGLQIDAEPIDGYRLQRLIGKGGFGEVWKATDGRGFSVAIKFVGLGELAGSRELHSLDQIKDVRHPHLIAIVATRLLDGMLAIIMELADRTLMDRLCEAQHEGHEGIPRDELLKYLSEAAEGIDFLNGVGSDASHRILHRDIKPQNLLLFGNCVKVADFSLAESIQFKVTESSGSTPTYAAPEQFAGTATLQSDQYSLAVTYCVLRTGRPPFDGRIEELIEAHRNQEPDLSALPPDERPVVRRALSKKPKDRWPSCSDFVRELRRSAELPSPVPSSTPPGVDHLRWLKSRQWKYAVATSFGGLILFLILWSCGIVGSASRPALDRSHSQPVAGLTADPTSLTLAVLDFENHSQDPALDGFRLGFRDMLTTDLSRLSAVKMLERSRIDEILKEHNLSNTSFIDPSTAVHFRRGLSAKALLGGAYIISGENIRVDIRVFSVETGVILNADAVEGTTTDIFGLQRSLAAKVIASLKLQLTPAEKVALEQPQTKDFEAFRLYSEARLAQRLGNQAEADARLRESLKRDPSGQLTLSELDRIETTALTSLTQERQRRIQISGAIGASLKTHFASHQKTIAAERFDPQYFTALLVVAAHSGLLGEADTERELLIKFWHQFVEHIPPSRCNMFSQAIRECLIKEGEFFQAQVDSGEYFSIDDSQSEFLKSDLRDTLHWPKWSAMWPFNPNLRIEFSKFEVLRSGKSGITVGDQWFNDQLPLYPSEFLGNVIDDSPSGGNERDKIESLMILGSMIRYYSLINPSPSSFESRIDLSILSRNFLQRLQRERPEERSVAELKGALPALESISQLDVDSKRRIEASEQLIRWTQQLRLVEGQTQDPIEAGRIAELFGNRLDGSPVIVCWYISDPGDLDDDSLTITGHVHVALGDVIRKLPTTTKFNFLRSGHVPGDGFQSLFDRPRLADKDSKLKGMRWFETTKAAYVEEPQSLESVISKLIKEFDKDATIVLVIFDQAASISQQLLDAVAKSKSIPRIHVITSAKHEGLGRLAAACAGHVTVLRMEEGSFGIEKLVVERWTPPSQR